MASTVVHVSNISPTTTEADLTSFFSFCGSMTSHTLTPTSAAPDAPLSATITFSSPAAASTAILLDGTALNNSPIHVTAAHSIDEIAGDHLATSAAIGPDGEIPQEAKPRTAILAEYLAHGYAVGDTALQRSIELDKKHNISSRFASYLTGALHTVESKFHATDRAKAADTQYHITEKASNAGQGLARYFEKAFGTPTGQKVRSFYLTGEKQVMDIHTEAKRLADLKKGRRRSREVKGTECTCVGEQKANRECKCEPGKCQCCEGCKRMRAENVGQVQEEVGGSSTVGGNSMVGGSSTAEGSSTAGQQAGYRDEKSGYRDEKLPPSYS
ncbi:hypothetical protein BDD12DRAFT_832711 [Trichophaea hybrida]|nr:hypothetical protein BDD12DRAFT_832711 [Trichophaea hybrida]